MIARLLTRLLDRVAGCDPLLHDFDAPLAEAEAAQEVWESETADGLAAAAHTAAVAAVVKRHRLIDAVPGDGWLCGCGVWWADLDDWADHVALNVLTEDGAP